MLDSGGQRDKHDCESTRENSFVWLNENKQTQ